MRILIISNLYAPDRAPRAYRWTAIAEYLAGQGHEVDVVAAWKSGDARRETLNGVRIHRVGSRLGQWLRGRLGRRPHGAETAASGGGGRRGLLARLIKAVYDRTWRRLFWPDYACLWYFPALGRAEALLRQDGGHDALVTVSHPFTGHLVGLTLKRRHPGLTWIADSGDPFSFFHEIPLNNHGLYSGLNRRTEAAVVARADRVTVTVESCRDAYAQAFPGLGHIAVVPPLLSLPDLPAAAERLGDGVHMVYVGTLYRAIRNPAWLLELTHGLVERGLDLHLHLLGDINDCTAEIARGRGLLGERLHVHGSVARPNVARMLAAAHILVNLGNSTPHQLPSKVVEYVAAAKPVLNLAPVTDDTSAKFLDRSGAALSLSTAEPVGAESLERAAVFLGAPPIPDPAIIAAILAEHRIDAVAGAYLTLMGT
ncbi:glycosyltransferase [Magnetospirillum sp. 15-1]|uniref:glycosyltransferase n=1 Tax=Magnetospirillum sp. 15-1 TaxID=1979370 RepID=UPI000BBCE471|nr:glycosyltransferase [Magnetospirillum sp. 15-1]